MNWGNIYQSIQQVQNMQNMEFVPMNNIPQMNNMNQMSNPMDQIQFMANYCCQNQNMAQMNMGGNRNFNNFNNFNNNFGQNKQPSKINLCFSTLKGARINMTFDSNVTVDEVLNKFLKRVNLEKLNQTEIRKLNFILSAETLNFGDFRKIKDIIFMPSNFTTVLVHDTQNLIGA